MIRKFLLLLGFMIVMFCSAQAPSDAQGPPPPPPGGGGGSEVIPPTTPPIIPPTIPPVTPTTPVFANPIVPQAVTPVTPVTPTMAAPQFTIPEFHSSTILPTDTLPFKVNGPLQVRLSQGKSLLTNFSVLLDEKSMLLVVAEKTEYVSETPIENPRVVTTTTQTEDNSPDAAKQQEAEKQLLDSQLLLNTLDTELPPQTRPSADEPATSPADDTATGKVEPVVQKPAKRTVMQKLKSFFQNIGNSKPKSPTAQQPERKENVSAIEQSVDELKTGKPIKLLPTKSTIELTKGCMLIKGHEPVKVKVAGKEVYVQHDATALIMTDGKVLKVITLDNRRSRSVYVLLDDKGHHLEIPLQQLWKIEGNKLSRLHNVITVQKDDKDPRQPKIQQWEADRMILNQILVQHPLVYSMAKQKSPYANHKCITSFQKTIAAFAVVNAQKRRAMGVPMEVPPQPGTYTIWDHFFVK
ncbi:MAG: hypothetical protein K2Y22_14470 [Candidatus Obscuribacterales bacterium]|nr:hypothetical protein [Candidatus Obscuribacterales bacterium]